jgi:hypothetical protein
VKNLRLRLAEAALSDILEQADWYELHSGQTLAKRWETRWWLASNASRKTLSWVRLAISVKTNSTASDGYLSLDLQNIRLSTRLGSANL